MSVHHREEEEPGVKDWSDIIPSAMVEQHRPKTGVDAYSDPEELFNPIAMRRKRRNAKKRPGDDEESAPNSAVQSRAGSDQEEKDGDDSRHTDISSPRKGLYINTNRSIARFPTSISHVFQSSH